MRGPKPGKPDLEQNAEAALKDAHMPLVMARNEAKVANSFWTKLARFARWLPFSEELVAAYYCAFDKNTPVRVRGTLLAALAYFILPTDLIPDILLGFGFTDDAAVIFTAISMVRSHIKPEHRDAARKALDGEADENTTTDAA